MRIRIEPSRYLAGLLALAHVLSWAVLYPLALPETLKWVFAVMIAASGAHSVLNSALLRSRHAIVSLEYGDEEVTIRERGAEQWQACRVLPTTFVSSYLTVLNIALVTTGKIRHVVLLPDNIDRNDFRRLRVRLRWSKSAAPETAATRLFGRATTPPGRRTAVDSGEE